MTVRSAAVLALLLAGGTQAPGGVYTSIEPADGLLSPDFRKFRNTFITLRSIGTGANTPLNKRYLRVQAQLGALPEQLTGPERLDLGAALLRLRKYSEAIQVLKPGEVQERDNFLLRCNLATAYLLAGQEARAVEAVSDALALWPQKWTELKKEQQVMLPLLLDWDEERFGWYRRAETYYKKLIRLRWREAQRQRDGAGKPPEEPDALFDDGGKSPRPVRFVVEAGRYEPGKIARAERDKLPGDALRIVQQLLVWLPDDTRLYWLLGELYNAQGDPGTALEIFNDLVAQGGRFTLLREHRRILQAEPRPGAGTAKGDSPPSPPEDAGWTPGPWQTLGIGFVAGLVVALLGYWQVREVLRRRSRAVSGGPGRRQGMGLG